MELATVDLLIQANVLFRETIAEDPWLARQRFTFEDDGSIALVRFASGPMGRRLAGRPRTDTADDEEDDDVLPRRRRRTNRCQSRTCQNNAWSRVLREETPLTVRPWRVGGSSRLTAGLTTATTPSHPSAWGVCTPRSEPGDRRVPAEQTPTTHA